MNWSLAERLPSEARVQENFSAVIIGYIAAVWERLKERGKSHSNDDSPRRRATPGPFSQVPATPMGVGIDETLKEFTVDLVSNALSQELFR